MTLCDTEPLGFTSRHITKQCHVTSDGRHDATCCTWRGDKNVSVTRHCPLSLDKNIILVQISGRTSFPVHVTLLLATRIPPACRVFVRQLMVPPHIGCLLTLFLFQELSYPAFNHKQRWPKNGSISLLVESVGSLTNSSECSQHPTSTIWVTW